MWSVLIILCIIINPKLLNIDRRIIEIDKMINQKNWSLAQGTTLRLAKKELMKQRDDLLL